MLNGMSQLSQVCLLEALSQVCLHILSLLGSQMFPNRKTSHIEYYYNKILFTSYVNGIA